MTRQDTVWLWGDLKNRYCVEWRNIKRSTVHESDVNEAYGVCEELYVTPGDPDHLSEDQVCTVSKKSTFLSVMKPISKEARRDLLHQCAVGCVIDAKRVGERSVFYC